jgi:hypothetical protein
MRCPVARLYNDAARNTGLVCREDLIGKVAAS